jgi:hypothetical protein
MSENKQFVKSQNSRCFCSYANGVWLIINSSLPFQKILATSNYSEDDAWGKAKDKILTEMQDIFER